MDNPVYRAFVIPPGGDHHDPLRQDFALYFTQQQLDGTRVVLSKDGQTWVPVVEGSTYTDAGLHLPGEVYPAFLDAVEKAQGRQLHGPTESEVLRQWLALEVGRVDRMLSLAAAPRIVDLSKPPGIELAARPSPPRGDD